MYAVFVSGGKQHRVEEGEVLRLEKIEEETGKTIDFDQVLLVGAGEDVKIGSPVVDGATVQAEVLSHGRADKVTIIKFRRRKHSMKRQGHRQWYTEVRIVSISADGAKPKAKAAAKPKAAPAKAKKSEGDDLTRISGVGPVIVGKLTAMGVTTFAQIAEWTPEDVEKADEKLNFKGRIDRDNWIEQAKTFTKEG